MKKKDGEPPDLKKIQLRSSVALMRLVEGAKLSVSQKIMQAARDGNPRNKGIQDQLFKAIRGVYNLLEARIDEELEEATVQTAKVSHNKAMKTLQTGSKSVRASLVKFDRARLAAFWSYIHPDNARGIAAVFTDKMAERDIAKLRAVTINTLRAADLEALTANERQKAIQKAWDTVAGDTASVRFVDRSGREWDNARYLQMLVRTTQQRVSREAYIDTIVSNGDDLMIIAPVGDNCEVCNAWRGMVISVTGKDERFPSYDDAIDAGVFHPGCDCGLERADETVHADKIEAQGSAKNAKDWTDLDQMKAYREAGGEPKARPPDEPSGTFSKDAARAYKAQRERVRALK